MLTITYPATFEKTRWRVLVSFPDFGWGVTDGADREETFSEARHHSNFRSRLLQQAPQTVKPRRAGLEPSFQPSVVHPLTQRQQTDSPSMRPSKLSRPFSPNRTAPFFDITKIRPGDSYAPCQTSL